VLEALAQESLVDLSALEEVDASAVEGVVLPISEVDVSSRVVEETLAVPQLLAGLSDVVAVEEGEALAVGESLQALEELLLLAGVVVGEVVRGESRPGGLRIFHNYGRLAGNCQPFLNVIRHLVIWASLGWLEA
jgi:hypothetical protein